MRSWRLKHASVVEETAWAVFEAHREAVRLHINRYVAVGGKAATIEVLESKW